MALQRLSYTGSISSIAAGILNSLRLQFIDIMKTGVDLEYKTADFNKTYINSINDFMKKSAMHERKAKIIDGWASIASGVLCAATVVIGVGVGYRANKSIARNNKGINEITGLQNKANSRTAGTGKTPVDAPGVNSKFISRDIKHGDYGRNAPHGETSRNIATASQGPRGPKIRQRLEDKKRAHEDGKADSVRLESSIGMFVNAITTAISGVSQGTAGVLSAEQTYLQRCFDTGTQVFNNLIDTNRTINQSQHEMASKYFDFAAGMDRIADAFDNSLLLRG